MYTSRTHKHPECEENGNKKVKGISLEQLQVSPVRMSYFVSNLIRQSVFDDEIACIV